MKRFLLSLLTLALIVGVIVLVAAPIAGGQYRLWRSASAVADYRRAASELDTLACGTLLAQARQVNEGMAAIDSRDAFDEAYAWGEDADAETLDVTGSGVIAVLELPKLGQTLPVYRGRSRNALARGVVHQEGTSLPVGGEGTSCVIAGQGGGRFAHLLDGLDRLIPGDCFLVQTLQDILIYEVERVDTLAPSELSYSTPDGVGDYCTLVTAPSADARLVVRARRVGRRQVSLDDDTQALPGWAARLIFAAPVALAGLIVLALIEWLRRAAGRRRVRRMKL